MLNKKLWTKPQLIVLTRGTPEESVLEHCKRIGDMSGAAINHKHRWVATKGQTKLR